MDSSVNNRARIILEEELQTNLSRGGGGRLEASKRVRPLRVLILMLVAAAAGGLCYLYGRIVEVNWIRISHVDIPVKELPSTFEGFEIVHLSDLHANHNGKRERKLPTMVNSLKGDVIFITGDFADTAEGEDIAASVLKKLEAKHGKWGVSGNWDSEQMIQACREAGVRMLLNETDTVEVDGERIGLIGLRFGVASRVVSVEAQREVIADLMSELPAGIPVILLEHEPRIIRAAQEEDIDLVLSGHTHGGQVRVPFGPALLTPSDMGIWFSKGLHKFKDTTLYINPGIGLEPGPDYLKVRFWCRPEITVIRLRSIN